MASSSTPETDRATSQGRRTRRPFRLGIRGLFALGLTALLTVAGVFAGLVMTRLVGDEAIRLVEQQQRLRAGLLGARLGEACVAQACAELLDEATRSGPDLRALTLLDAQFQAQAGSPSADASRDPLVALAFQSRRLQAENRDAADGAPTQVVTVPVQHADGARVVLRAVFDLEPAHDAVLGRQRTVIFLLLFDFVAVLGFGIFLGGRVLVSPLLRLTDAVQAIAARGFEGEATLPTPQGPRELERLGVAFGEMLTRLRTQQQELAHQLEVLERTRDDLVRSEKLATVGRLAAGVAHEVGNPLSAVLGFVEYLRDPRGTDPATQKELLARMDRELQRMQGTVRQLLDFSRPSLGDPRRVAVRDLVTESVELVRYQRAVRSVTLDVRPLDPTLEVFVDPQRLGQVLVNLLLNAGEALEGQGTIVLSAEAEGEGHVALRVSDDGPGVAEAARARIFEPFETTKASGTGLGLAISARLVEEAHGTLSLEATETGRGACFVIRLPRAVA